jgi:hypothetical protein
MHIGTRFRSHKVVVRPGVRSVATPAGLAPICHWCRSLGWSERRRRARRSP